MGTATLLPLGAAMLARAATFTCVPIRCCVFGCYNSVVFIGEFRCGHCRRQIKPLGVGLMCGGAQVMGTRVRRSQCTLGGRSLVLLDCKRQGFMEHSTNRISNNNFC